MCEIDNKYAKTGNIYCNKNPSPVKERKEPRSKNRRGTTQRRSVDIYHFHGSLNAFIPLIKEIYKKAERKTPLIYKNERRKSHK